jgi:multidrug efflux pump subunit AcrA (membrane-fusion protein)
MRQNLKKFLCYLVFPCSCSKVEEESIALPKVEFIKVSTSDISVTREIPARISSPNLALIRPQVDGIVINRLFTEGSYVEKGQILYCIDDSKYKAAYDNAKASLSGAVALEKSLSLLLMRNKKLQPLNTISKQELDDTISKHANAQSAVESATALLNAARINLENTKIKATLEASKIRLRPIVMTSLCFILGVLPLAFSNGAGAGAQNSLGTSVMTGMIFATVLGVFFTPVFFVVVMKLFYKIKKD